jgi:hypothetical protein
MLGANARLSDGQEILITPTTAQTGASVLGFDGLLLGRDSHLFERLSTALITKFVLRLRYSQPEV